MDDSQNGSSPRAKAVSIGDLFYQLTEGRLSGYQLGKSETNDAEFLLVPRAVNGLVEQIAKIIRWAKKGPVEKLRVVLPPPVRELLLSGELNSGAAGEMNRLHLGEKPDRVHWRRKKRRNSCVRFGPRG